MAMRHDELDAPLVKLTPIDAITVRDLAAHVLVTGASGAGKTTGAGEILAGACLKAGSMGLLVCCFKSDEADLWHQRCTRYGRLGSLIRWNGKNHRFNFIAHCLERFGIDGIGSVIEHLMTILEVVKQAGSAPGRPSEQFWTDSIRSMLRHSVPLLYAATSTVRIADLLNFVQSAPQSSEQMNDPDWQRSSYFCRVCMDASDRIDASIGQRCGTYWRGFVKLDGKTRSNILISLTTALDRFNHGWLREAFTTESTITPELCFFGCVIVMDMSPTTLGEDGLVAQLLFKHCWQQAMLARNALEPEHRRRFCALYADECQAFVQRADADFLAVCRSSRVCVVYLTQNLPTLYSKIGGENPQHVAHHLLGNFGTKVWHANSCAETNEWAAKTIGRKIHRRNSFNQGQASSRNTGMGLGEGTSWGSNSSIGFSSSSSNGGSSSGSNSSAGSSRGGNDSSNRNRGLGTSENTSWGFAEQADHIVEPGAFGWGLKSGGSSGFVTAIWYQTSRIFAATGENHLVATFRQ